MDWLDQTELEWSSAPDLPLLRLGQGEVFEGEATPALAKALLQSGVSYIGGYQGAPMAYLMDCLGQATELLDELGVHYQPCANEASAAAMLGASVVYPVRGCAIWKSVAGTAVASDALANLATAGVVGGAMVIIGADYGEGSNVGQERTHATALKSQMWLLDPRPDLPTITRMVEKGFELSEASNTPVMLELRIRATHVYGRFTCKDNVAPRISSKHRIEPAPSDYARLVLPPSTFDQDRDKVARRLPAARDFILREGLNELVAGAREDIGIILQGGLYNAVMAGLRELGCGDVFGRSEAPMLVLNVTYPIVPQQVLDFCRGKRAVLMVEEGHPAYLEQELNALLRKAAIDTELCGKDVLPEAGEYTAQAVLDGLAAFLARFKPEVAPRHASLHAAAQARPAELQGENLARPAGFCTGCPERPVFSALKLVQRELGPVHVSSDIGCHLYSSLPPFNMSNSVLGYGLGLASSQGVEPLLNRRVVSTMGDGGFWHNGLNSGISSAVQNGDDSVLLIFDNGYTSSTGAQMLPSSLTATQGQPMRLSIEAALRAIGVKWSRRVRTFNVARMVRTLRQAMTTQEGGLKVVVAQGECQLAIQRRERPKLQARLQAGERTQRTRFGVDDEVCTGDHSCIRLSGCPSLTVKTNPDPLRQDPVAAVSQGCVGCGLCGEVAHVAVLCPSFYKATVTRHPGPLERWWHGWRSKVVQRLQSRRGTRGAPAVSA